MSNRNNPHNLPPLSPEGDADAEELEQTRREQPVMSLEELRAQTPSWVEPSPVAMPLSEKV